jgi:hypothetical protein
MEHLHTRYHDIIGIYAIKHVPSGMTYIGHTKELWQRTAQHIRRLRENRAKAFHPWLAHAYNKTKDEEWTIEVVQELPDSYNGFTKTELKAALLHAEANALAHIPPALRLNGNGVRQLDGNQIKSNGYVAVRTPKIYVGKGKGRGNCGQ